MRTIRTLALTAAAFVGCLLATMGTPETARAQNGPVNSYSRGYGGYNYPYYGYNPNAYNPYGWYSNYGGYYSTTSGLSYPSTAWSRSYTWGWYY